MYLFYLVVSADFEEIASLMVPLIARLTSSIKL
jgi:hypothetical protein